MSAVWACFETVNGPAVRSPVRPLVVLTIENFWHIALSEAEVFRAWMAPKQYWTKSKTLLYHNFMIYRTSPIDPQIYNVFSLWRYSNFSNKTIFMPE